MTPDSSTVEEPTLTIPRPPRFWGSRFGWWFAAATCVAVVGAVALVASMLAPAEPVTVLRGIMASKQDFFNDEEVQRLLAEHGIRVEVTTRGSSEVALEVMHQESDQYDFAFPSGQPAADQIKNHRRSRGQYQQTTRLFTSPIVLASYREYAETLVDAGAATPHRTGTGPTLYYTLDTEKFIALGKGPRPRTWNDLGIGAQHNSDGSRILNGNRVLAHNAGVCRSNSAATYLGLIAFVHNNGEPPATVADIDRIAAEFRPVIGAGGMPEAELFMSYVTPEGKSQGPIVVVYEHQFLAYQLDRRQRTGRPDEGRVLLYPAQEFQTDPELISFDDDGYRLARLLATDDELRRRMMELGYRVTTDSDILGTEQLFRYLDEQDVPHPPEREDVTTALLPELDLLERLIEKAGGCSR